ncbi:MAG: SH3 domain-containing protein [Gemmatimonadota bacterium]
MPYTVCPNCGQKALKVATRCPRCGIAFEAQFYQHSAPRPRSNGKSVGILVAGVAVVLLVANALWRRFDVAPAPARPAREAALAPPAEPKPRPQPQPPRDSPGTVGESLRTAPLPQPRSPAPAPVAAPKTAPTGVTVEPSAAIAGRYRYASTWMNVRAERRNSAPVLRILHPGEAVQVDSFSQGWYRVVSSGEQAGWVDRRLLDTVPPPRDTP